MSKLLEILQERISSDDLWTPFTEFREDQLRDVYWTILANSVAEHTSVPDLVLLHSVYRACKKRNLRVDRPRVGLEAIGPQDQALAEQSPGILFALGAMYYEDELFEMALFCFEACISMTDSLGLDFGDVFPVKILAAYTCENLGLEARDIEVVRRGLAYLSDLEANDEMSSKTEEQAELFHAMGHLNVAHEILATDADDIVYGEGGAYLKRASKLNPEFLSCYTASFSEVGQFEKTAAETIKIFHAREKGDLDLEPSSEMELLFYLASSYLFLGEYELSRKTFLLFQSMAQTANLTESIDYALFYLEKIDSRKNFLQEYLDSELLNEMEAALANLAFRSYQSEKLRVDCASHIECLKNLSHAIGRSRKEITTDLVKHWIDEVIKSIRFLDLSEAPLATVYAEAKKRDDAKAYFHNLFPFVSVSEESPKSENLEAGVVGFYRPGKTFKTRVEKALTSRTYPVWMNEEGDDATFLLGLYLLLANRLLSSVGDYIFRLSPCQDATTTKSQRPRISLGRLTQTGLKNHDFGF